MFLFMVIASSCFLSFLRRAFGPCKARGALQVGYLEGWDNLIVGCLRLSEASPSRLRTAPLGQRG